MQRVQLQALVIRLYYDFPPYVQSSCCFRLDCLALFCKKKKKSAEFDHQANLSVRSALATPFACTHNQQGLKTADVWLNRCACASMCVYKCVYVCVRQWVEAPQTIDSRKAIESIRCHQSAVSPLLIVDTQEDIFSLPGLLCVCLCVKGLSSHGVANISFHSQWHFVSLENTWRVWAESICYVGPR